MNISSDYNVTGNNYELRKVSSADSKPFSIPDDAPQPVSKSGNELQFRGEISKIQNDYRSDNAYTQIDSQRENFLQKYVKGDEEEDEKEDDGRLLDYFLKALKHEEEELVAEGNSYMDDEARMKFLGIHCPDLFPEFNPLAGSSGSNLSFQST